MIEGLQVFAELGAAGIVAFVAIRFSEVNARIVKSVERLENRIDHLIEVMVGREK